MQLWWRSVAVGLGRRWTSRASRSLLRRAPPLALPQITPTQRPREETWAHSMHLEHLRRPSSAAVQAQRGCGSRYDVYLQSSGGRRLDDDLRGGQTKRSWTLEVERRPVGGCREGLHKCPNVWGAVCRHACVCRALWLPVLEQSKTMQNSSSSPLVCASRTPKRPNTQK